MGEAHGLGHSVRSHRDVRGLSLRELAKRAGVSESFLSQVERGVANPSIATLQRIAQALETSVGALFEGEENAGRLVRASERPCLIHPQRQWQDFMITPRDSKRLQVILSIIEEGGGSGGAPYAHNSDEECVLVLKGCLELGVGAERHLLMEGDSLTFESRIPHWNRNPGPGRSEVLWITTPPSY